MCLSTEYLFKYRNFKNIDGSINIHTCRLLEEGELFFAKPSQFEDEHDCEIWVFLAATNKAIRDFWKNEIFPIDPDHENLLHKLGLWGDPQKYAKWYGRTLSKEKSNASEDLSLYCLCENSLQEDMWRKYAAQEGLCVGFRAIHHKKSIGINLKERIVYNNRSENFKSTFLPFLSVQYEVNNLKKVNRLPTSDFKEKIKFALLTKNQYWSFEDERRAFVYNSNLDQLKIGEEGINLHCDEHSIGEIIFSEHINESTISQIRNIIGNRKQGLNGVKFYRTMRNEKNVLIRIQSD